MSTGESLAEHVHPSLVDISNSVGDNISRGFHLELKGIA